MPSLASYTAIKAGLERVAKAAYPEAKKVYFGQPMVPTNPNELDVVVFALEPVPGQWETVRGVLFEWTWTMFYFARVPSADVNVLDWKVEKANQLAPVMEAEHPFEDVGMNPVVIAYDFATLGGLPEGMCSFAMTVQMKTLDQWGA